MTCYDLRFPELARSLADAGAQVLLVCSSWVPGEHKTGQWLALNAARAIENSVYVAGVCQAPPVSVGRSVLVDPMGVVEADLRLEPGVLAVEVSLETGGAGAGIVPDVPAKKAVGPGSERPSTRTSVLFCLMLS